MSNEDIHCGCIDDVELVDKHKFPLRFYPENKWSRKGYLRSRWRVQQPQQQHLNNNGTNDNIFDLVNIHLFHDASNLKSVEKVPSIYVNYRQKALNYTLDRVQNTEADPDLPPAAPFFIFGDFNFRLEGKSVVRKLTGDNSGGQLQATAAAAAEQQQSEPSKAGVQFFRDLESNQIVLSIGKKEFDLKDGEDTFNTSWESWIMYDLETDSVKDRLAEFPLCFPPDLPVRGGSGEPGQREQVHEDAVPGLVRPCADQPRCQRGPDISRSLQLQCHR